MSASRTPLRLSFFRTVKAEVKWESSLLTRFADVERVTQAMKREGVDAGISSEGVVVPLEAQAEIFPDGETRMPDRIAIPRVP